MELMLLRIYQSQVAYQRHAVLLGDGDIKASLAAPNPLERNSPLLRYGIQNLLIGADNLSKTLWGTGRTETEAAERYAIRQPLIHSFQTTDDSPLRRIKVRNDFEHLDERIETWWDTSTNRNYAGELVGPRGSVGGNAIGDNDILRWFDPSTGHVIFWGNELNIPEVVGEVQRLLLIAENEGQKPHWTEADVEARRAELEQRRQEPQAE